MAKMNWKKCFAAMTRHATTLFRNVLTILKICFGALSTPWESSLEWRQVIFAFWTLLEHVSFLVCSFNCNLPILFEIMLHYKFLIKKSISLHIPTKITADSFFNIYLFIKEDPVHPPFLTTCYKIKNTTAQKPTPHSK